MEGPKILYGVILVSVSTAADPSPSTIPGGNLASRDQRGQHRAPVIWVVSKALWLISMNAQGVSPAVRKAGLDPEGPTF